MAPTDTNDASASKSSLLWAYQLRQEHVHLVGRIDNIDADLHSSAEKTNGFTQSFSDLRTLIKALESENGNLKSEMNAMNDVLLCTVKRLDHYHKKTPENISKIQADHGSLSIRVQQLAHDAAELRAGIQHVENKCAVLEKKQIAMAPSFLLKLKYKKKVDESMFRNLASDYMIYALLISHRNCSARG
jgi:predicted  nucleic acid-binding Zn-ribbon protein